MSYLSENVWLHEQAWKASVPYTWRDYASWKLIAELSRRWPGTFDVIECPYNAGNPETVWYLSYKPDDGDLYGFNALLINNGGSITVNGHDERGHVCEINNGIGGNEEDLERFATLDILYTSQLRRIVMELESCFAEEEPPTRRTPSTVSSTIGQRTIASALGLFLHTRRPLRVTGFLYDGDRPKTQFLPSFKTMPRWVESSMHRSEFSQLFFVHEADQVEFEQTFPNKPILAFNFKNGLAYTHQSTISLMNEYKAHHRDIESLAFALVKQARREKVS